MDVDSISRPHYKPIYMTTARLPRSKRRKSEKKKCYSTIKNIGFTAYCAFATMTTIVRGQIATISASREIRNVQRAHSNVNWTINIYQPMALITVMIGKDALTYGDMKRQPEKPQFITEMQKKISDHKKRKHLEVSPPIGNKRGKNDYGNLVLRAKKGQHHWKGNKIKIQNLCARWNAGERHKLLGNVCPSSAMDER